jgi:hypothetical protein
MISTVHRGSLWPDCLLLPGERRIICRACSFFLRRIAARYQAKFRSNGVALKWRKVGGQACDSGAKPLPLQTALKSSSSSSSFCSISIGVDFEMFRDTHEDHPPHRYKRADRCWRGNSTAQVLCGGGRILQKKLPDGDDLLDSDPSSSRLKTPRLVWIISMLVTTPEDVKKRRSESTRGQTVKHHGKARELQLSVHGGYTNEF